MECIPFEEFVYTTPLKSAVLEAKAAALLVHKCFCQAKETFRDHRREKPRPNRDDDSNRIKWMKKSSVVHTASNINDVRPKLACASCTADPAKRKFLPLLNKLTDRNHASIMAQVQELVIETAIDVSQCVDLLWRISLSSPSYQALYADVLNIIASVKGAGIVQQALTDKYHEFYDVVNNFVPPEDMVHDDYDEFCDYVKWKKQNMAGIKFIILLEKRGYIDGCIANLTKRLLNISDQMLEQEKYVHVDVLLDQLLEVYSALQSTTECDVITTFVQKWTPVCESFKPSTRFKFYTFTDILEKNSRSVSRWRPKSLLNSR